MGLGARGFHSFVLWFPAAGSWKRERTAKRNQSLRSFYDCLSLLVRPSWQKTLVHDRTIPPCRETLLGGLGWFPFKGRDSFHRLFRKMAERNQSKRVNVFISVSFSLQMSLKFLLGAIWSGYSRRKLYTALFLLNRFSRCQVDPLKPTSPHLTF